MTLRERPIAVVVPSLGGGGAERVSVTLTHEFAQLGNRVDLIVGNMTDAQFPQDNSNVRIVPLDVTRMRWGVYPLAKYLRTEKPRAMLSILTDANFASAAAISFARSRTPLFATEHRSLLPARNETLATRRLMTSLTYRKSAAIVAVSQGVAAQLRSGFPDHANKIVSIPNPLPIDHIRELSTRETRHEWFRQSDIPVIVAIGRLHELKGLDILIHAVNKARARRELRLLIVGEGPERPRLETLIGELAATEWVSLLGFARNPYSFMRQSDLFVLPSRSEAFPMVLAEALAVGCRIVSTDCDFGPTEILDEGRYGSLVPVGDVDAMAESILTELRTPGPRQGAEDQVRRWSSTRVASRYLELMSLGIGATSVE